MCLSLAQLQKDSAGRFGVDKSDFRAARSIARFFINKADAICLEFFQRRLDTIDTQGQMLDALPVFFDVSGDGSVGGCRFPKLDFRIPHREKGNLHLLLSHHFRPG